SHLFFYPLTLIARVWLCVILQWVWPSAPTAVCPTAPQPPPPRPKRHRALQPFQGFITKPHCNACALPRAPIRTPPQLRHRTSCPCGGAAATSTPHTLSARIQTVPTGLGWDGAISGPMGILTAVPGGSGCASFVATLFARPSAHSFMGSAPPSTS